MLQFVVPAFALSSGCLGKIKVRKAPAMLIRLTDCTYQYPYHNNKHSHHHCRPLFNSDYSKDAEFFEELPKYVRYSWKLPSSVQQDPSLIADTLLELGAVTASVVPSTPIDISSDDAFHKTGRVKLNKSTSKGNSVVEFWIMNTCNAEDDATFVDIQAEGLARGALSISLREGEQASILGELQREEEPIEEWNSSTDSEGMVYTKSQPNKSISIGGHEISITTSLEGDDSVWAFGDGFHPSTALSLRGLEEFTLEWQSDESFSLLDFGCGTGILTVAGLALGAGRVTAIDISDDALKLTKENIKRNSFGQSDVIHIGKEFGEECEGSCRFDAVIANIPSTTLITLFPTLACAVRPCNGRIMTAGYPSSELDLVSEAASRLGLQENQTLRLYESGWVLQAFSKSK